MWTWLSNWFRSPRSTPPPKPEFRRHPLVGEYHVARRGVEVWGWSAQVQIGSLDYQIGLMAPGSEPTTKIMDSFLAVLEKSLELRRIHSEFFTQVPMPRAPHLPPYSLEMAEIESLWMRDSGNIQMFFEYDGDHGLPYPTFEFNQRLDFEKAYWSW